MATNTRLDIALRPTYGKPSSELTILSRPPIIGGRHLAAEVVAHVRLETREGRLRLLDLADLVVLASHDEERSSAHLLAPM